MSNDKREDILARLYTILKTIKNVSVYRNIDELPEDKRPCLVLLDGDEVRSETSEGHGLQTVMMVMAPVISIGVSAAPDDVGGDANALRAKILPAILGDTTLLGLIGKEARGRIKYNGASGKLSHGSLMAADLQLNFEIYYLLNPADLA